MSLVEEANSQFERFLDYPQEFQPFLTTLERIVEKPIKAAKITVENREGVSCIAYRIILTDNPAKEVLSIDLDDTSVDYSKAKAQFHRRVTALVPQQDQDQLQELFVIINALSRVLPPKEKGYTHPKRYSPLLEMATISLIVRELQNKAKVKDGFDWKKYLKLNPEEKEAYIQQYITRQILPRLEGRFKTYKDPKREGKVFFAETKDFSDWLDWNERPEFINEQVWQAFCQTLLEPELLEEGVFQKGKDRLEKVLGSSVDNYKWILATFGVGYFQLEKVARFLKRIKSLGLRVPDEIIYFEVGRKIGVLEKLLMSYGPEANITHIDNSQRQIDRIIEAKNPQIIPIHLNPTTGQYHPFHL